jgi:hypothetical protein
MDDFDRELYPGSADIGKFTAGQHVTRLPRNTPHWKHPAGFRPREDVFLTI